jgi:predicted alpha/beta-hydrolase family hydrolase
MEIEIAVGQTTGSVSGLWHEPASARAVYVFAHGAGANMRHHFMADMAERFGNAGIATLRYNFPYMQNGGKRPDPPAVLEATVRAAINKGIELAGGRTLVAGGKSMGGRMTSQLLSKNTMPEVRGLVFVGFPLHQPNRPSLGRADHLATVQQPMLFLQGTRDTLADLTLITQVTSQLPLATLHVVEGADHSFAVLKRSGRTTEEVYAELVGATVEFCDGL